jgi:Glycosyl transferases group 1
VNLPTIELLVDRDGRHVEAVMPLLVAMRNWSDPHAPDPGLGPPAARIAVSANAVTLDAALEDRSIPVAVVVEDPRQVPSRVLERARVILAPRSAAGLDAAQALAIPADLIDVDAHPPLSPFVRSRWRERTGLPANLVVRIGYHDPWPTDDASIAAALSVCSAAAVRGPWTLLALALGTAVVTDRSEAERLGARDGVEVIVDEPTGAASRAESLGGDWPRAGALGNAARRHVEQQHSWPGVARELLDRLGVERPRVPAAPLAGIQRRLDDLGTPAGSPAALRALRHGMDVAGGADLVHLTGSRR